MLKFIHWMCELLWFNKYQLCMNKSSLFSCFFQEKMPQQLLEGMSSRKRRPNWTDPECLLLAHLIQDKKEIIRGKCSTGVSIQDKRQAWEEIAQALNEAFPQIQRTVSDCNKKWENLIAKSREEIKRQKRQAGTGEENGHFASNNKSHN